MIYCAEEINTTCGLENQEDVGKERTKKNFQTSHFGKCLDGGAHGRYCENGRKRMVERWTGW
jgi:hypothetical protein